MGSRSSERGSKIELMEEEMPIKEDVGSKLETERETATSSCSK